MREAEALGGLESAFEVVPAHIGPGRRIPLLGTIAAGDPLPAFQVLESIDVPGGSWRERGCLRCGCAVPR